MDCIDIMNYKTYSRAYLQGIPDERKQQEFDHLINRIQDDLLKTAATGKTSYRLCTNVFPSLYTIDNILAVFQKIYPDCKVTHITLYWSKRNGELYIPSDIKNDPSAEPYDPSSERPYIIIDWS